jgi:hypothetical protein
MAKNTRDDAALAAVVDAAVEEAQPQPSKTVSIVVDGETYTFPRSRLRAIQFRREMQRGHDALAIEFLLGETQFDAWLERTADDDGVTSEEDYAVLMVEVGKVFGVGN